MNSEKLEDSLYIKGRIGWKGLKKKEYLSTSRYRIINASNLVNGRIDWKNCGYITKERYEESPEIMLHKNDILISKDGTIGKVAIVNDLNLPTTIASGIFLIRNINKDKWNTKYLFYFFQSRLFAEFVFSRTEGSVIPHLYQKDLASLQIPCPSLKEQKSIAEKIDVFNQKIKLDNQINQNLLFQCNETVSAFLKMNRSSGIDMINDIVKVTDHVANGSFKSLKDNTNYFDTPNYALFLRNVDFKNNLNGSLKYIDKSSYDYLQKTHLHGGEVVISNVADVGSVHRVPYLKQPMVLGNNQIVLKSKNQYLLDYLYVFFNSFEGQNTLYKITSGSAQQKFNKTDFRKIELKIPKNLWIKRHISPFLSEIDILKKENTTLIKLRQILLNKYFDVK